MQTMAARLTLVPLLNLLLWGLVVSQTLSNKDSDVPNRCPQPSESEPFPPPPFYYGHPDDCSYYFTCAHGNPTLMPCSPGSRWSDFFQTCGGINTRYDTCTRDNAERECQRGGFELIPHPTKCHRYYNCSQLPFKESECRYPDLFDVETMTCKPFKEVDCGLLRIPGIDACRDYTIGNPSGYGHAGPPCFVGRPSCLGLQDGLNVYQNREWSPWHVRCDTERTMEKLYCRIHEPSRFQGFFSPIERKCVSLWEVPTEISYGKKPSCDDKEPGQYSVGPQNGPPYVYYSCPSGQVHFCPVGEQFNEATQQCESSAPQA